MAWRNLFEASTSCNLLKLAFEGSHHRRGKTNGSFLRLGLGFETGDVGAVGALVRMFVLPVFTRAAKPPTFELFDGVFFALVRLGTCRGPSGGGEVAAEVLDVGLSLESDLE